MLDWKNNREEIIKNFCKVRDYVRENGTAEQHNKLYKIPWEVYRVNTYDQLIQMFEEGKLC